MYRDFPPMNPEGERLLVLSLAGKLSRKDQDALEPDEPGVFRKLMSGLRQARPRKPLTMPELNAPCGDLPEAAPVAR